MGTRYFALILGIIYLIVGIMGFFPGLIQEPVDAPALSVDSLYGYLLGLFPVNILHTIVHLAVGIWGLFAYASYTQARFYARTVAIIFGVLTLMGLIPGLSTTFGLIPLFGHDVWLHALTTLGAAYFGWVARPQVEIT